MLTPCLFLSEFLDCEFGTWNVGCHSIIHCFSSDPPTVCLFVFFLFVHLFVCLFVCSNAYPQILRLSASDLASNLALMLWMRVCSFSNSSPHLILCQIIIFNIFIVRSRCLPWVQDQGEPRDLQNTVESQCKNMSHDGDDDDNDDYDND